MDVRRGGTHRDMTNAAARCWIRRSRLPASGATAFTGPRERGGRSRAPSAASDRGVRQDHPGLQARVQVVQDLRGDPLAGDQHRDARRVGRDLLSRDAPDRLICGHHLGRAEECFAGHVDGLELQLAWIQDVHRLRTWDGAALEALVMNERPEADVSTSD